MPGYYEQQFLNMQTKGLEQRGLDVVPVVESVPVSDETNYELAESVLRADAEVQTLQAEIARIKTDIEPYEADRQFCLNRIKLMQGRMDDVIASEADYFDLSSWNGLVAELDVDTAGFTISRMSKEQARELATMLITAQSKELQEVEVYINSENSKITNAENRIIDLLPETTDGYVARKTSNFDSLCEAGTGNPLGESGQKLYGVKSIHEVTLKKAINQQEQLSVEEGLLLQVKHNLARTPAYQELEQDNTVLAEYERQEAFKTLAQQKFEDFKGVFESYAKRLDSILYEQPVNDSIDEYRDRRKVIISVLLGQYVDSNNPSSWLSDYFDSADRSLTFLQAATGDYIANYEGVFQEITNRIDYIQTMCSLDDTAVLQLRNTPNALGRSYANNLQLAIPGVLRDYRARSGMPENRYNPYAIDSFRPNVLNATNVRTFAGGPRELLTRIDVRVKEINSKFEPYKGYVHSAVELAKADYELSQYKMGNETSRECAERIEQLEKKSLLEVKQSKHYSESAFESLSEDNVVQVRMLPQDFYFDVPQVYDAIHVAKTEKINAAYQDAHSYVVGWQTKLGELNSLKELLDGHGGVSVEKKLEEYKADKLRDLGWVDRNLVRIQMLFNMKQVIADDIAGTKAMLESATQERQRAYDAMNEYNRTYSNPYTQLNALIKQIYGKSGSHLGWGMEKKEGKGGIVYDAKDRLMNEVFAVAAGKETVRLERIVKDLKAYLTGIIEGNNKPDPLMIAAAQRYTTVREHHTHDYVEASGMQSHGIDEVMIGGAFTPSAVYTSEIERVKKQYVIEQYKKAQSMGVDDQEDAGAPEAALEPALSVPAIGPQSAPESDPDELPVTDELVVLEPVGEPPVEPVVTSNPVENTTAVLPPEDEQLLQDFMGGATGTGTISGRITDQSNDEQPDIRPNELAPEPEPEPPPNLPVEHGGSSTAEAEQILARWRAPQAETISPESQQPAERPRTTDDIRGDIEVALVGYDEKMRETFLRLMDLPNRYAGMHVLARDNSRLNELIDELANARNRDTQ